MVKTTASGSSSSSRTTTGPLTKKARKSTTQKRKSSNNDDAAAAAAKIEIILDTLWEHYCNYFEPEDDGPGEPDELAELLDIVKTKLPNNFNQVWELPPLPVVVAESGGDYWKDRRQLVPLLVSVVSTSLATDLFLADYMALEQLPLVSTMTMTKAKNNDSNTTGTTTSTGTGSSSNDEMVHSDQQRYTGTEIMHEKYEALTMLRQSLRCALETYPNNAAAMHMAINFVRMTTTNTSTTTTTAALRLMLAKMYAHAADTASHIRRTIIRLLNDFETQDATGSMNVVVSDDVQTWIVALLLNQVCDVHHDFGDMDEEEEEDDEEEEKEHEELPVTVWSSSKTEGISRYMSAMMYSMIQQHDLALQQLQLLNVTHRLHPLLWQSAMKRPTSSCHDLQPNLSISSHSSTTTSSATTVQPMSFRGVDGVIPKHLYDRLCHVFQPNAYYWYESSYASRGYFSFYMDILPQQPQLQKNVTTESNHDGKESNNTARNVIDDVVCNYLLPFIQNQSDYCKSEIIGYEWWVHTRAMSANLGHNLHFDTDETSLQRDGTISHPTISSVLYLTGGNDDTNSSNSNNNYQAGPTIILDQTPESTANADRAWYSHPINNSFMMFPGNLLHGVLPCTFTEEGTTLNESNISDESISTTLINLLSDETTQEMTTEAIEAMSATSSPNRLTLMIGFWTRNVPGDMDPSLTVEDRLYGPCSPLPTDDQTRWVRELCAGYGNESTATTFASDVTSSKQTASVIQHEAITATPLPCVSPAWEEISVQPNVVDVTTTTSSTTPTTKLLVPEINAHAPPSLLLIPKNIDHRFFVIDAPDCFKSQLMEAQYCVDAGYYDDEDEDENHDYDDDDDDE